MHEDRGLHRNVMIFFFHKYDSLYEGWLAGRLAKKGTRTQIWERLAPGYWFLNGGEDSIKVRANNIMPTSDCHTTH